MVFINDRHIIFCFSEDFVAVLFYFSSDFIMARGSQGYIHTIRLYNKVHNSFCCSETKRQNNMLKNKLLFSFFFVKQQN